MHTMIADTGKSDTAPDIRQFENILRPGELASYGVEWSDCSRATPLGIKGGFVSEGAEVGYNPVRPGRPSQSLHVGFICKVRLLVSVDVQGGKSHGACHMAAKICNWVDALPLDCKPALLRADSAFGNEGYLCACEARALSYLFKLKLSKKVQKLIGQLATNQKAHWQPAPGGWTVIDARLTLKGWSRERRIVVMRRPISSTALRPRQEPDWLPHLIEVEPTQPMEYAAVVCSAELPLESVPTLYAERGDCENVLDELKNQWGLSGFTTQDILRSKVAARLTALICNWWNVFARIAEPTAHMEAITSRAELLCVMALLIVHGGKNRQ